MHLFLTLLVLISMEVVVVVFATSEITTLGTNAPPATFDGWTMTAVPDDTRQALDGVNMYTYLDVEALDPNDPITFNTPVAHEKMKFSNFVAWNPTYKESVYWTLDIDTVEIVFPQDTCAFIFYLKPNSNNLFTFSVEYASGNIVSRDIRWGNYFTLYPWGLPGPPESFAVSYCPEYGRPVSVSIITVYHNDHGGTRTNLLMLGEFSMSQCGPDTDGDSIPDLVDNCPNDANPGQCDYDGDGYGDVCDPCLFGVNDVDRDNDGVPDACDKCPGFDDSLDRDGDGIPDACDICPDGDNYADIDSDGIPDCIDNCVHSPNADQADTDDDGIGDACEDNGNACCINDCSGVASGNYQSCVGCSVYATCDWGKLIDNRPCPGGLYWDANIGGCVGESGTCDPNGQSTPCPPP